MELIHPTALIGKSVKLGRDVSIGPYSTIEDGVSIGDGTKILAQAHIREGVSIGKKNFIDIGVVIGGATQRLDAKNGGSVAIGDNNTFREYVTVHRSSNPGTQTKIGNSNFFMVSSHVAHDCVVGDSAMLANAALLGGHVILEDHCILGGGSAVHQFCRIGRYSMVGGCATVTKDVLPYMLIDDNESLIGSLNIVGLRRAGFSEEAKRDIKNAYKLLYLSGLNFHHAMEKIIEKCRSKEAAYLIDFTKASKRGILGHRKH